MESAKVTVETTSEPQTVEMNPSHGGVHFFKTLCSIYLSRKFIVTITFGWIIYGIYWGAVKVIFAMENGEQLRAFTTIFTTMMGVMGSIALGYLGFTRQGSPGLQSYVSPSRPATSSEPVNRNWKADPNDR